MAKDKTSAERTRRWRQRLKAQGKKRRDLVCTDWEWLRVRFFLKNGCQLYYWPWQVEGNEPLFEYKTTDNTKEQDDEIST